MSIESAASFIERMNTDGEFAKRTMELRGKEEIISFLKAGGYDFSEEEFKEAMKDGGAGELSDNELEGIAGGGAVFGCACYYYYP